MGTISIEKRQRGFFGWIAMILFWLFNAIMALVFVSMIFAWRSATSAGTIPTGPSADAAAAITYGTLFIMWGFGAAIFGLFAYMTRGRKVILTDVI
jgi:hypothetical protein